MGFAAALLVFTGIWHMTEFLMDRRTPDTMKLIPFGAAYLGLGLLIVFNVSVAIVAPVAAVLVSTGMTIAVVQRKRLAVRQWVLWAFIVIDAAILLALARHWF